MHGNTFHYRTIVLFCFVFFLFTVPPHVQILHGQQQILPGKLDEAKQRLWIRFLELKSPISAQQLN